MKSSDFEAYIIDLLSNETLSRSLTREEMLKVLFYEFLKEENKLKKEEISSGTK